MPTAKTKPSLSMGQKPWDKLGITYQQYYYRNKAAKQKGDMPLHQRLQMLSEKANEALSNEDKARDRVLLKEFLDRCEARNLGNVTQMMEISASMANTLYNILRQDGH